jgi:hypothetical protein
MKSVPYKFYLPFNLLNFQDAELIQITGRSDIHRGRHADTQISLAESSGSDSANPANDQSRIGQSTSRRFVRKPGRHRKGANSTGK